MDKPTGIGVAMPSVKDITGGMDMSNYVLEFLKSEFKLLYLSGRTSLIATYIADSNAKLGRFRSKRTRDIIYAFYTSV
jgi:hypothetical protein